MKTPVKFELAKLLKEKGFDVPVNNYTSERDGDYFSNEKQTISYKNYNEIGGSYSRPTIAEVVMWLYEKHGIWISILCDVGYDTLFTYKLYSTKIGSEHCIKNGDRYDSPTEAYEAGIKHALKNLL